MKVARKTGGKRKGGWIAPVAASVLGGIAPLVFNKIFGEGKGRKRGGMSAPYTGGRKRLGGMSAPYTGGRKRRGPKKGVLAPGLAAYMGKKCVMSPPYVGGKKKGKLNPGLAAYLAKKYGTKVAKGGAIVVPGPSSGPLI